MKKFYLSLVIALSSLSVWAQLNPPPTTNSTSTGAVAGGDIATCNFAPGTPNSCIHICRNSVQISGLVIDATPRTVHFEYYQVTNGAKSLHVQIFCGSTLLVNDCIDASADPQNVLMYKEYTGITCANKNSLVIKIQAHTNGTCGGTICGPLLISTGGSPLPVNLSMFTATRKSSSAVVVEWQTATEQNSDGFAVERNIRGTWEQVALIPSQASGGYSNELLNYSYSDQNSVKGVTQYRIRQIDFDGMAKISDVRSVRGDGQRGSTIVYPNPSNDGKVNVIFEGAIAKRNITVQDMSGRTVKEWKNYTNNNIQIENLTPGFYTIKIVNTETGEQDVEKAVVNKR